MFQITIHQIVVANIGNKNTDVLFGQKAALDCADMLKLHPREQRYVLLQVLANLCIDQFSEVDCKLSRAPIPPGFLLVLNL